MTAPPGFFNPNQIEPGDLVHITPTIDAGTGGGVFCATIVREFEASEYVLFLGVNQETAGDTWFWMYVATPAPSIWSALSVVNSPSQESRIVGHVKSAGIIGLIKCQADRAAIAALLPTQTIA